MTTLENKKMKHEICRQCIHMKEMHCLCGSLWNNESCIQDLDWKKTATTPQEYLTLVARFQGAGFQFMIGDLIGSRQKAEYFSEPAPEGTSYFSLLSAEDKYHLENNAKEFNLSIFEIVLPKSNDDILVLFLLSKDEKSLLENLKRNINSLMEQD